MWGSEYIFDNYYFWQFTFHVAIFKRMRRVAFCSRIGHLSFILVVLLSLSCFILFLIKHTAGFVLLLIREKVLHIYVKEISQALGIMWRDTNLMRRQYSLRKYLKRNRREARCAFPESSFPAASATVSQQSTPRYSEELF